MNEEAAQFFAEFKANCAKAIESQDAYSLAEHITNALLMSGWPHYELAEDVHEHILEIVQRDDVRTMPDGGSIVGSTLGMQDFISGDLGEKIRSALLEVASAPDADHTFPMSIADQLSHMEFVNDPDSIVDLLRLDKARKAVHPQDHGRCWILESLWRMARDSACSEMREAALSALRDRAEDEPEVISKRAIAFLESISQEIDRSGESPSDTR